MYEIVLGGNGNKQSFIRNAVGGYNEVFIAETPNILDCAQSRPFWMSWMGRVNRTLAVGRGKSVGADTFMQWTDTVEQRTVGALSLVTGWGSTGNWTFLRDAGL